MSGSGVSLRKRLFNPGTQACPWTQHKHQLTSFDTLQIMFQHFLVNYPFNAELWRDFCSPINLWTSLFHPDRTFFFPLLSRRVVSCRSFPPLSFSLLHLSLKTHSPSVRFPQLVHISSPHSVRTPPSRHPFSASFSLLYLLPTSACRGRLWGAPASTGGGEYVDSHSFT